MRKTVVVFAGGVVAGFSAGVFAMSYLAYTLGEADKKGLRHEHPYWKAAVWLSAKSEFRKFNPDKENWRASRD